MSSDSIRIYNFDRYGDRYVFQHSTGLLNATKGEDWDSTPLDWDDGMPDVGNLKKFWFSRNVLVYAFAGIPYMKVGRRIERIDRADAVKQFSFGPFCMYRIKCGRIRMIAFGTVWFDFISRLIDPTYDEIDSLAADFAGYVQRTYERTSSCT